MLARRAVPELLNALIVLCDVRAVCGVGLILCLLCNHDNSTAGVERVEANLLGISAVFAQFCNGKCLTKKFNLENVKVTTFAMVPFDGG